MLGLLSHKLLKVFDVFHVNIRRNSIGCKEYYHIFPPGCGVITETQIRVFYRNLASSRFVITIYCFVANYIPYLLKMLKI